MNNNPFQNKSVEEKFASYPNDFRTKLLTLRELIFEIAKMTEGVGEIEETLKWGEPSYLTSKTKSGSTIRIDWKKSYPDQYSMYFNCKTTLVDTFKEMFGDLFNFEGNREMVFHLYDNFHKNELSQCIAMALTYHLNKR